MHPVGFITNKFVMMRSHMNVKLTATLSRQYTLLAKLDWVVALVSRNIHN